MIATMARSKQEEFDLDFEAELPPNQEYFPLWQLAKTWKCSLQHVINLAESGELGVVDLKGKGSSKAMCRAHRKHVAAFLNRRQRKS